MVSKKNKTKQDADMQHIQSVSVTILPFNGYKGSGHKTTTKRHYILMQQQCNDPPSYRIRQVRRIQMPAIQTSRDALTERKTKRKKKKMKKKEVSCLHPEDFFFFFYHHFYFPAQLVGGFTLSDLLDKP